MMQPGKCFGNRMAHMDDSEDAQWHTTPKISNWRSALIWLMHMNWVSFLFLSCLSLLSLLQRLGVGCKYQACIPLLDVVIDTLWRLQ
jgi:hypothetical protein